MSKNNKNDVYLLSFHVMTLWKGTPVLLLQVINDARKVHKPTHAISSGLMLPSDNKNKMARLLLLFGSNV